MRITIPSVIGFLIFCLISCKNSEGSEMPLTKLNKEEFIQHAEDMDFPQLDSLLVRDPKGDIIFADSIKRLKQPQNYFMDYYKNENGKIVEGVLRKATDDDRALIKKLDSISLTDDEKNEIARLNSIESKNAYLQSLWDADQALRDGKDQQLLAKYGKNSIEYRKHRRDDYRADQRIFEKMTKYLEVHGYPQSIDTYHWKAVNAFPTIIGHNGSYTKQLIPFKYMVEAYKKGDCAMGEIVWILGEMHERKNRGQRYKMKLEKYKTEDEFNELVQALDLGHYFL